MSTANVRSLARERGQAMVEMVVSMVALVPLILFTLFLQEFLSHHLDWQEGIVSSPWDALSFDYVDQQFDYAHLQPPAYGLPVGQVNSPRFYLNSHVASPASSDAVFGGPPQAKVQGVNRMNFCDHNSARSRWDLTVGQTLTDSSFDPITLDASQDCKGLSHRALGAQPSWSQTLGALQITCSLDSGPGQHPDPTFQASIEPNARRGGVVSCTSRLAIVNYLLPNRALYGWPSERAISDKGIESAADGDDGSAANAWVLGQLTPDSFGVLHDSWGLNTIKNIDPGYAPGQYWDGAGGEPLSEHPLYKRTHHYYNGAGAGVAQKAGVLEASLFASGLNHVFVVPGFGIHLGFISPVAYADGPSGNDPRTPSLAYRRHGPYTEAYSSTDATRCYPAGAASTNCGYEQQNFGFNLHAYPWTAGTGQPLSGQFASGWHDPNQRSSWNNRDYRYFGREESGWVDANP